MTVGDDPRGEASVRPTVALPAQGVPWWGFALAMLLGAILLFSALEARRNAATAPAVRPRVADGLGTPAPPPPLYIPPVPAPQPQAVATIVPAMPAPPVRMAPPPPQIVYLPPPGPPPVLEPAEPATPRASAAPALVVDLSEDAPPPPAAADASGGAVPASATAARASVLRNHATTVPQGTLIPAVLETALDSTRAGPARALVSRDVRGFDGSRVLIPKGSRLIGEYRADLQPGQNRALVMWTRLVRPDGVTIAIGSPAADPLGRIGVRGEVNSHFFQRFGSAILQSALDIGVNRLSQVGGTPVIVALPGLTQSVTAPATNTAPVQPTLRVKQGTSVSVFVARDLDFTGVEARR